MALFGVEVSAISFYGGGIRITSSLEKHKLNTQLIICLAGCVANIVFAVLAYCMGSYTVGAVNTLLAIINLLPLGKLDGARIVDLVLLNFLSLEHMQIVIKFVKILCIIIVLSIFIIVGVVPDITFIVFSTYLMLLDRFE